ncbi:cobalt transporter CbiM [Ethanoligenens sp.]|uniref:cobalt transporter CbiM n=1 Tax=Ethanoligenens sp. TaxID=2099655 RepID=UPI0039EB91F7
MHIPDGYLAPQTTIPVLAGMIPMWTVALNKVKKTLSSKRIPTLALCAAFAFVLMMFNIPVAGGSSAHAVGAVFIAILLGPWAATVSVSTALLIQALVFGDGGIISFGVNCLNMAVVMPFTGYFIYRLIAGKSKLGSGRNFAGAFIGSYLGLNLAATCAGLELGIQPLLFKTASGTPLFCPYPLSVSIPSMLLAHGIFAGPLEAIVTTAALAYIIKFAPNLFSNHQSPLAGEPEANVPLFQRHKAVLIPFAVLIILTPLGLLASGTAWGEWGTSELKDKLGYIPKGLAAMADKWHAMLPDYGLPFGKNQSMSIVGYLLSAIVGIAVITGLIILTSKLIMKAQKSNAKNTTPKRYER